MSEVREIIKCETDNALKNDITYLEKHIDTLTSEVYFPREELKEKNLLKELRNPILRTILAWPLFSLIRLYVGLYFLQFLLEN